ncbi:hypothetical protein E4K72_21370, partial [Oxalobacteraceae bacterium OM1]
AETAAAPADDLGSLDISIPGLDVPPTAEELASAPKVQTNDPMAFDLSEISLELDPSLGKFDEPVAAEAAVAPAAEDVPHIEALGDLDELPPLDANTTSADAEMATKLDLAIAYQEIGDKEGARELLDEVMKGGSPEQSEKARSLLLELA